jgi:hypothetical protein
MVETRGPLRSFVSVGLRLCRISNTMIVPPIRVEHSINSFEGSTNTFVKIKGMSAQFFLRTLKVDAQKCISGSTYWQSSRDCC